MISDKILFFDTFAELKVDTALFDTFSSLVVVKASASQSTGKVIIDLMSDKLIRGIDIRRMESVLSEQIFANTPYTPIISIEYTSAKDYTTSELLDLYEEDFFDEMSRIHPLENYLFCSEHMQAEGDVITITCGDDTVTSDRMPGFEKLLKSVFRHRFGREIQVNYNRIKKSKKKVYKDYEYYAEDSRETGEYKVISNGRETYDSINDEHPVTVQLSGIDDVDGNNIDKDNITDKQESKKENNTENQEEKKGNKVSDTGLIYGKNVDGERTAIIDIAESSEEVVIEGMILKVDTRELKSGKLLVLFSVTDFTDTIVAKAFFKKEEIEEYSLFEFIHVGAFIRVKGRINFDDWDHCIRLGYIQGIQEIDDFRTVRKDTSKYKRVELHAHTQMSDLDGMTNCEALVKRAHDWGHQAVAITDHGVVQSFPDAESAMKGTKDPDFKIIYGCEMYLVDDLEETVVAPRGQSLRGSYVVFDIETTGFSPTRNKIIEIGAVKVEDGKITDRYSTFIDPQVPIPPRIKDLTKITDDMVHGQRLIDEVLPEFLNFCEGCVLVAHNSKFDHSFICAKAKDLGIETDFTVVDTVGVARVLYPHMGYHSLRTGDHEEETYVSCNRTRGQ